MKTKLVVSSRGQITLPAEARKAYGLGEGSVLFFEDRNGELILKPTTVLETDYYTDDQINGWVKDDAFNNEDDQLATATKLKKLAKGSP